jgi:putative transcriptional regulator
MTKAGERILKSVKQALAYADGTADRSKYRVTVPSRINVKAIRRKLGMTQQSFAAQFGFSVNTLRHWEQGKRVPEGPTRAYLLVIHRDPRAVQRALRIG